MVGTICGCYSSTTLYLLGFKSRNLSITDNWTLPDGRQIEIEEIKPDANANSIVENAFVPDSEEERPRQTEEKLTDIDDTAAKTAALMAALGNIKIAKGYFGDPKNNGKHLVTLHSYEAVLKDDALEYIRCEFRDRKENNIWVHNLSLYKEKKGKIINNLEEKLTELSYSNKGILGGRTKDAFAILLQCST